MRKKRSGYENRKWTIYLSFIWVLRKIPRLGDNKIFLWNYSLIYAPWAVYGNGRKPSQFPTIRRRLSEIHSRKTTQGSGKVILLEGYDRASFSDTRTNIGKSPVLVAPLQTTEQMRVPSLLPSHLRCPGTTFTHCKLENWVGKGKEKQRGEHSLNAYPFPINRYELGRKGQDNAGHRSERDSNITSLQVVSELARFSSIFHPYKKGLGTFKWQLNPG